MRTIQIKKQFKQDLKSAKKNPRCDVDRLHGAIEQLAITGTLPEQYRPHLLSGNWKPSGECHIQPDFLLIYQITDDTLTLIRCGSHSELF
jgi:mRNA interferase YafQ